MSKSKNGSKKLFIVPVLILVLMSIAGLLIVRNSFITDLEEKKHDAYILTQSKVNQFKIDLDNYMNITETFAYLIDGSPEDNLSKTTTEGNRSFNTIAEDMYDGNEEEILSIQLAPKGIVKYAYPSKTRDIYATDLFNDSRTKDASVYTMENQETTFVGPLKISSNLSALAIVNPVFREDEGSDSDFYGFAIVYIKLPEIFNDALVSLDQLNYEYLLRKTEPVSDEYSVVLESDGFSEDDDPVSYGFQTGDCAWRLYLSKADGWVSIRSHILELVSVIIIAFLLAVLSYFMLVFSKDAKHYKNISYIDALTQLNNRRSFENLLKKFDESNKDYGIIYLDLNHFKEINDTYGHDAGDQVLISASRRMSSCVREDVYRLGGDEFAIIVPDNVSEAAYERIAERIRDSMSRPLYLADDKVTLNMTTSIGYARKGVDGSTSEEVIEKADERMYQNKVAMHAADGN